MKKMLYFILLAMVTILSACQYQFDEQQAEAKALSLLPGRDTNWYLSSTRSEEGQWVVRLQSYESECEVQLIYLSKKDGAVTDQRGGNECQSEAGQGADSVAAEGQRSMDASRAAQYSASYAAQLNSPAPMEFGNLVLYESPVYEDAKAEFI
ncbi:hypothetical protein DNH61_05730 [Paenibacillus sambharensis]|uniref:Uncharacterized protein n=1 Tax=Paenibacillus sambharensis TaxID=1803190 RepID=A0A2W1LF83_9BACL|nr:hypothetical protein [Paenibacillus sambharensis]PZD96700.1 hypothetical protein DNH61_05730 [Paenibacillus sambharensis]